MKKHFLTLPAVLTLTLAFPRVALAHCPLCTAGVLGGLTLTRWLGFDDVYSGLWLGGLMGSLSFWYGGSLKKRYLPFQEYLIFLALFLLTTIPFLYVGIASPHAPRLFGVNRLFAGLSLGGAVFILSTLFDKFLRRINKGRVFIPYQGVLTTLGSVIVAGIILFLFLQT